MTPGHNSSVGVLNTRNILNNWSISESPCNDNNDVINNYTEDNDSDLEQWSPVDHLRVDGSNGPDVDGAGILGGSEQNFWSSVPQGHNLVSVHSDLILDDENITIYFVTRY